MGTRTSPEAWIGGRNGRPADVPLDATSTHGGDRVRSVCAERAVSFFRQFAFSVNHMAHCSGDTTLPDSRSTDPFRLNSTHRALARVQLKLIHTRLEVEV
jgi:hypothetical protein